MIKDEDDLDLPEAPEFISRAPRYTAAEMAELCEKMLPVWNKERESKPPKPFLGGEFLL